MKSDVSDLLELLHSIYLDACAKCTADVSDFRDLVTIKSRVKNEGLSFLTITLPKFSQDFEKSLRDGFVDPTSFRNFRKFGAIPAFLRGMLGLIFDSETGRIYDKSCTASDDWPTVIDSVRQICCALKKVGLPCAPERDRAAIESFVTIEQTFDLSTVSREDTEDFLRVSSVLWDSLFHPFRVDSVRPKHGPGATADHVYGNRKYDVVEWTHRLETYFPLLGSGYSLSAFERESFEKVKFLDFGQERPVRVTLVPKTLKGPRIIAIEPSCMQFAQQGIRTYLYDAIESYWLTKGHINFRDQSVNQSLAMSSSIDGRLATVDLSDASDRVPRDLALRMFDGSPELRESIDACRSTRAELPDGRIIFLKKFASMGSALCFPVEAMYFYTICVVALLQANNLPVSQRNIFKVSRDLYVYGDDIVVPSAYADTVLVYLRKYNCKINREKTFECGNFRESCGVDAYNGYEVTPIYIRKLRPKNRQQASEAISWVSTANLFYKKGYWRTSQLMFSYVERVFGVLPYTSEDSPVLGRFSYLGYRTIHRWNVRLHRFEVKGWLPRPVRRTDVLDGDGALVKSFIKLRDLKNLSGSRDALHLERSELHHAVALTRGWSPVS